MGPAVNIDRLRRALPHKCLQPPGMTTHNAAVSWQWVNDIQAMNPVYNKWYMDDGGIVGDVELLRKVWEVLKVRGPPLGLHLNPSKCEWSWLDPSCTSPCPIRLDGVSEEGQVKLVPHSEIQMLGV